MRKNLNQLIDEYGDRKAVFDVEKKGLDSLSSEIKAIMRDAETECATDIYVAKFNISERTSMNEDKAIALLKGTNIEDKVIKTKAYIDTDVLEDLIYRGEVDKDLIAKLHDCIEVKKVETLRVTKKKGAK